MKARWLIVCALLAFAVPAFAWDEVGHRQVADIAWSRLNEKAKKEIASILMAGDPITKPASTSEADVREAFRKSAVFPDTIKGNKATIYEESIESMNKLFFSGNPPDPKDNEDNRCKTWHYYDIPIHAFGPHPPKESNALAALTKARADIASLETSPTPDRKLQCWWLCWIAHLVGDLHQPLHCASNYSIHANGDAGGNLFMIKIADSPRPGRLHGLWDGAITRAIGVDRAQSLPALPEDITKRWSVDFAPASADVLNLDVMSWITSGAALADNIAYVGIEENQTPSAGYVMTQSALCRRQAVLAGSRLAAILNDTIGK